MPTRRLPVLLLTFPSAIDHSLTPCKRLKGGPTRALRGPDVGTPSWFQPRRCLSSLELGHAFRSSLITLRCCLSIPRQSSRNTLGHPMAFSAHAAQAVLRLGNPLVSCLSTPPCGLLGVLGHALALAVHGAQAVLRMGNPLVDCLSTPPCGPLGALGHALALEVQVSQAELRLGISLIGRLSTLPCGLLGFWDTPWP